MDPRLIEGLRRGQAEERDRKLAGLLVERRVLTPEEAEESLAQAAPGALGARLVERGRVSAAQLEDLENDLRLREVLEAVAPAGAAGREESLGRVGRYEIRGGLGGGAMGEVVRAFDPELGREVALKFLAVEGPEALRRFLREARIAARLAHPHIPRIYDMGQQGGQAWLAFEYVRGHSLAGRTLPRRRAAEVVRDAARAVQHAHEAGVIHRDLKPGNLMLDDSGQVFVLDFGLAKAYADANPLTRTGTILGTPAYLSPEQARGFPADERTDVYGLGATLYALLAGHAPFQGPDPLEVARRAASTAPEPLPEVDDVARIANRAMARERRARFASAAEMAEALEGCLAGRPLEAPARSGWRARLARLLGRGKA